MLGRYMATVGKQKTKKKWLINLLVVAALIIIGGLIVFGIIVNRNRKALSELASLETVPFSRGSLTATISGTGTIRANQTALLSWNISGTVGQSFASLGLKVFQDDILLSLDETSIPIEILQAKNDLISVQNSLDDLYANAPLELAQAKLDLINAEKSLEDMAKDREIMNYQRCTDDTLADLQEKYDDAVSMYDRFESTQTRIARDTALANLNYCQKNYTEHEKAQAEARILLAEERITSLKNKIEILQNGPDPDNVTVLETQLQIAQARIDKMSIKAPFDSIVTAIYNKPGDVVTTGVKAIQLADLSTMFIDVQISEVDIPLIKIGQNADLLFDAFYEEEFTGKVVEIAPVGNESQGVVSYSVTVQLLDGLDKVKPGMTAAVSIITEEKNGVMLIPLEALTTQDGVDIVYVMRNNKPVAVEVGLGAFSDDQIEITSGDIEIGELIVINPPTSLISMMTGPSGDGFPGFMNRR